MTLRVLDLFSGIGGFSLGLERTGGFKTVAFCEIEEYPRRVLAKHWPGVPIYHDVRELTADTLSRDGIAVDVICGGFPCQDISLAGAGAGIEGARSGLWGEYARLIGELRPRFVIVENVAALLGRGLGRVLGDLAALWYDAQWDCIPASAVGAPHRRDRVWIVATDAVRPERRPINPASFDMERPHALPQRQEGSGGLGASDQAVADATSERCGEARGLRRDEPAQRIACGGEAMADTAIDGRQSWRARHSAEVSRGRQPDRSGVGADGMAHAELSGCERRDEEGRGPGATLSSGRRVAQS